MKSFTILLKNELKLNLRNMNMVIFAILMPLVILLIFGFIYGNKPAAEGEAYTFMEKSFSALCCISICSGGLMGLPLLVSEYRERKILKRFQVTPVSPTKLLTVDCHLHPLQRRFNAAAVSCCRTLLAGEAARFPNAVFRLLAAHNAFHIKPWPAGGRHCQKPENRQRNRLLALFSDALLFRHHCTARGYAGYCAKNCALHAFNSRYAADADGFSGPANQQQLVDIRFSKHCYFALLWQRCKIF